MFCAKSSGIKCISIAPMFAGLRHVGDAGIKNLESIGDLCRKLNNLRSLMPIPARYKWVIVIKPRVVFLAKKPREIRGGFMDKYGAKWIYRGAKLMTRQEYEEYDPW